MLNKKINFNFGEKGNLKKILLLFITILLLIQSCSSSKKDHHLNVATIKKEIIYPDEIRKNLLHYPLLEFDFNLDTLFIQDTIQNHNKFLLPSNEVKILSSKLNKDKITEVNDYYLNDYYSISQAKKRKKYEEFVKKLDIGMMKDVNCYALNRLEFGDSLALLIWKLEFSSYEACPSYSGIHFLGTIITQGKVIETMQIASHEIHIDAPIVSKTLQQAKIFKTGKLKDSYESIVSEENKEIEHIVEKHQFILTSKGFEKN